MMVAVVRMVGYTTWPRQETQRVFLSDASFGQYSVFTHNFFCALSCSGVKVVSYELEDVPFDLEALKCPGINNIAALSADVTTIAYNSSNDAYQGPSAMIAPFQGILELIRGAREIETLKLQFYRRPDDTDEDLRLDAVTSRTFFTAVSCRYLTELELISTTCYTVDMVAFLGHTKKTLRKLTMVKMSFVSQERRFVDILQQLETCSQLCLLRVGVFDHGSWEEVRPRTYPAFMIVDGGGAVVTEVKDQTRTSNRCIAWEEQVTIQYMLRTHTSQWSAWCGVELYDEDYCWDGPCVVNHHIPEGTICEALRERDIWLYGQFSGRIS